MYKLKENFIAPEGTYSFKDKLLYEGYDDNTRHIRLHYIVCTDNVHRKKATVKVQELTFQTYEIPQNMQLDEAIKTYSYVIDEISKIISEKPDTLLTTQIAYQTLPKLGFKEAYLSSKEKFADLYVVGGNKKLFHETKFYKDYFDWYQPQVKKEEIESLYKNINIKLPKQININFNHEESEPGEE